jgi:hypothetical protein
MQMLYVMLLPGRYEVSARFKGVTQTQGVTLLDKDGKDLQFRWDEVPRSRVGTTTRE